MLILICSIIFAAFGFLFTILIRSRMPRERVCALVGGFIFSLFTILSLILKENHSLRSFDPARHIPIFMAVFAVFSVITLTLLKAFAARQRLRSEEVTSARLCFLDSWIFSFLVLVICWVPVFLALYPGVLSYDALSELYLYTDDWYQADHGVFYTKLLGFLITFGWDRWGIGTGLSIYCGFQALCVSSCLAGVLTFLARRGSSRLCRMVLLALFGIFPLFSLFAFATVKDVLFSALGVLFLCILWDWENTPISLESFWKNALAVLCGGIMILLRLNGAVLMFLCMIFLIFRTKPARRRLRVLLVFCLILGIGVGGTYALNRSTDAETSDPANLFSLPLQQLGRAAASDPDSFTEEQISILNEILCDQSDEEDENETAGNDNTLCYIAGLYNEEISDPLKYAMDSEVFSADPARYLRVWAEVGRTHPIEYAEAFLVQNLPYYSPTQTLRSLKIEFNIGCFELDPAERTSLLPSLLSLLESYGRTGSLGASWTGIFSAPALPVWICIFLLLVAISEKRSVATAFFPLAQWFIMLFSPVALNRYVLLLYYAAPVLLLLFLAPRVGKSGKYTASLEDKKKAC